MSKQGSRLSSAKKSRQKSRRSASTVDALASGPPDRSSSSTATGTTGSHLAVSSAASGVRPTSDGQETNARASSDKLLASDAGGAAPSEPTAAGQQDQQQKFRVSTPSGSAVVQAVLTNGSDASVLPTTAQVSATKGGTRRTQSQPVVKRQDRGEPKAGTTAKAALSEAPTSSITRPETTAEGRHNPDAFAANVQEKSSIPTVERAQERVSSKPAHLKVTHAKNPAADPPPPKVMASLARDKVTGFLMSWQF
ncbi:uncharacterized protein LOC144134370 [Amblyomma americanum]